MPRTRIIYLFRRYRHESILCVIGARESSINYVIMKVPKSYIMYAYEDVGIFWCCLFN